jgi:2-keto-4-pentenoate hydratase/2-oxohepta-3-ene-1,7-dioic acid hydratase in catechol pathway
VTLRPSKILCVGRNDAAHARELGNELPSEPLFFMKPPSSLLGDGGLIVIPSGAGRVDFEGEIAFVLGVGGRNIPESDAWRHVSHILPLNDVTARELQKKDGQWTRAKGFDTFCPVGTPVTIADAQARGVDPVGDPASVRIETLVNDEVRQSGSLAGLHFSVPALLAWISRVMTLEPGDLLATGTPAGVGPLSDGDRVEVRIPGVGRVQNRVTAVAP